MRRLYFSLGKNKFWEYVLLALFLLFFYGPLMNMLLLSFAGDYEYPDVIPRSYGFKWWDYVLSKAQLVQSIGTSLVLAVVVTLLSLAVCLPAAYALARYPFRGRSAVRLSFLLTNAFPKMGIYTAMAVIFYKLNLIGTFAGVVLVHIVNTMMFMVWIPSGAFRTVHDKEGVPTYDIKQNVAWDNIPFTDDIKEIAANAGAVCWGSLAQRSEVSRKTIYTFLDHTPEDCLKIFDINLRQNFYTPEVITESLKRCNVLKINDEELITIGRLFGYPGLDIENKCWLILGKYNLDMLVLTCGVNGSYVFAPGVKSFQETPKVEVADTVGAGDSFTGTFCASILKGKTIQEAHELAVKVSAYVCTQNGAMPQIPEEYTR